MTRRAALILLVCAAASCHAAQRVEAPSPAPRPANTRAPALDLSPGPPATTSPQARDPLWQRAEARDPIDLVRLADREGAAGLLAGLELGRSIGLTALAALPHAEDGEVALARLCALATELDGPSRSAVLASIHGVVSALVPDRERLAGAALRDCDRGLAALAADRRVPPADRDLAESSRSGLSPYLRPSPAP